VGGGVEILEIDGDHGSIMNEPTVAVFAQTLRNCLAKAQENYSEVASAVSVEACN
jgi:thioesterase domain-containing protein